MPAENHFVYLARCNDGSLYCGTCVNLKDRERVHNDGKGAKYTRGRLPVTFIYSESFATLSEARSREAAIKKLTRDEKESLIRSGMLTP